jgi:hypothetical protein
MRILRLADDCALAAEMLNFESGKRVMGPDFKPLPPPHEACPIIDITPVTKRGVPFQIHYRPALGVVYCVLAVGDTLEDLAKRMVAILERAGYKHLSAYRAVAATAAAVMRRKGRALHKTVFEAHRDIDTLSETPQHGGKLPARLVCCSTYCYFAPPCSSNRAVFTWLFLPIDAIFGIVATQIDEANTEKITNAVLAGIVHDPPGLTREDIPRDTLSLVRQDFGNENPEQKQYAIQLQAICGVATDGALILQRGRFRFTGRWAATRSHHKERCPPNSEWPDMPQQCSLCDAPLDEVAMVLRGAKCPTVRYHQTWHAPAPQAADRNMGGREVIVLCQDCFIPKSCVRHLEGTAVYCKVPLSQVEICALNPRYAPLLPILEGKVSRIEGVAGAFSVQYGGEEFVVVGGNRGGYPAICYEAIARRRATVIPLLNIIEDVEGE